MPDAPDFAQIAQGLAALPPSDIIEQLRVIWNARGAADREAIDEVAHTNQEAIATAIKDLDR